MKACNDPVLSETCTQIRWYLNEASSLTYGAAAAQTIAADTKTAPTPCFQPLRRIRKTKANGVRTSATYLIKPAATRSGNVQKSRSFKSRYAAITTRKPTIMSL